MKEEHFKTDEGESWVRIAVGKGYVYQTLKAWKEEKKHYELYKKYNNDLESMLFGLKPLSKELRSINAAKA